MSAVKKAEWILRIALFGEFLGHGVFALLLKEGFVDYITIITGVTVPTAQTLLFLIGIMDVAIAFVSLVYPFRLMLIWATIWGFWTALLRPLAGDPIWDFFERWANWGTPLALLYLRGMPKNKKEYFQ